MKVGRCFVFGCMEVFFFAGWLWYLLRGLKVVCTNVVGVSMDIEGLGRWVNLTSPQVTVITATRAPHEMHMPEAITINKHTSPSP